MSKSSLGPLTLGNPYLFWLAILLSVAGLWLSPFPPLVDLPQHAAQIVTLQEFWSGNPDFTAIFEINWFAPYTATYLVYYAFALVFPVVIAGKLLISLAVIAVPLLTRKLLQETDSAPDWSWLTIPCSFSVAFYWGFLPFLLATAVGLYLLLLTVRFGSELSVINGLKIAMCTVVLFFLHIFALGFVALMALVYLAIRHVNQPGKIFLSWLPYTVGLPLIVYWFMITLEQESYVQGARIVFGSFSERLLTLLSQLAGQGASLQPIELVLGAALLLMPFIAGARLSRRPIKWLPLAAGLVVLLLVPAKAFGAIFLYQRLAVFLMPLLLLALEFPATIKPRWQYLTMVLVLTTTLININRFSAFNNETLGLSRLLAVMDERKAVMYLPVDPWASVFPAPVHFHTGVWYQTEKRGIVDFNFAYFYPSMVRFKEGEHAWILDDTMVWKPLLFDWDALNGEHYDYFIAYAQNDMTLLLFKNARDKVELVENAGWWWLYKRK